MIMTGDALHGCEAKLARAEQHLDALNAEIRDFLARKPYRVAREINRQGRKGLYRVQITEGTPAHWPGLLGDCVHNFRCALDHLTWQIVQRHGTPKESTQFPIYPSRARFRLGWNSKVGTVRPRGLKTAFDSLQPYRGRIQLKPLWLLHRLDVVDKHRELLTTSMPQRPLLRIDRSLRSAEFPEGPFDDAADVLHIRVTFGPDGPMHMDIQPFFQVQVADVEITPGSRESLDLPDTLFAIRDAVRRAVERLRVFCD
jgi:hypothetical protein